jgi:hypothetical protein
VIKQRLSEADHYEAARYVWEYFHDKPRLFRYGDYKTKAEADLVKAIESLEIKGPKEARDLLVNLAYLGARGFQRGQGGKTFHSRNRLLALIDDELIKYFGAENDTERREIIREALACFGHHMDDGAIRKGIEAGRGGK